MKILVIGAGGREHALVWKISQDAGRPDLFCAPGNPGTARLATNLDIAAEDVAALVEWAKANRPDLTVVGPEVPLCDGITDAFNALGLKVFGPVKAAAQLEGSKAFSKEIMRAANVPTAHAEMFTDAAAALAALPAQRYPLVIKADGLAAGKGVVIAPTQQDAEAAIRDMMETKSFGAAGDTILLEEFMEGEEASILALIDGKNIKFLPSSQDHKRVFDNDQGPNTGGMGAYSPAPVITDDLWPLIRAKIFEPMVAELNRRGIPYKGVLYGGLMITKDGPKVVEFNCRFGDPEAQVVLPRIQGDIVPLLLACVDGTLDQCDVNLSPDPVCTVVMAAPGYPGSYKKNLPITGVAEAEALPRVTVFQAGTAMKDGQLVTSGGRVLTVTAFGATMREAVDTAYSAVKHIHFDGAHFRKDIAHRALDRNP